MNENIFVRNESQHNTREALKEVLHVPYTYSSQTMQSIAYSVTRVYNTVTVHCKKFILNLPQKLGSVLFHTEEVNSEISEVDLHF